MDVRVECLYDSPYCNNGMLDYQKLCSDIMNLEQKIRMATICDSSGKIIFYDRREGITNLLSPEESRKSLEMAVKSWKTRNELANKLGKGKYVLAEYEKIKRITMPLGDNHLLYITTEADADHSKILDGVRRIESRLE